MGKLFKRLGIKTIVSQKTNSFILNDGVVCCTNETCLPVKVFHGHILSLTDVADYIFVPRYLSVSGRELCCPKLCGLADMIKYNIEKQVKTIEININTRHLKKDTCQSIRQAAETLGINYHKMLSVFKDTIVQNVSFGAPYHANHVSGNTGRPIVVLGHSYMIYDEYLSMGLIQKLKNKGFSVFTPANLNGYIKKMNAEPFVDKFFFNTGLENLGAAFTYMNLSGISGVIYLSPFACGVDSLTLEFIERKLFKKGIPFLKLTVDEHTGEAGFDTRLEAFLDMIV